MAAMGRPASSKAWNQFSLESEPTKHAKCVLCGAVVQAMSDGSIIASNLNSHVKSHRITNADVIDVPLPGSRNFVHAPPHSTVAVKRQAVIPASLSVPPEQMTQLLLELIILAGLSFSFVGNPALIRMLKVMQPSYKVPHRTTMAVKAEELYKTTLAAEKERFITHGSKGSSLQVRPNTRRAGICFYCSLTTMFFWFF